MYNPMPHITNLHASQPPKSFWVKIIALSLLILMFLAPHVYAQKHRIKFKHITIEQGLSHNNVYAILQDSKGIMWFGTYVGLGKYDGYKFTVYKHDPDDPTSLSHNAIVSLYEDRKGVLWIGTAGGGLNRFDRETGQFIRYQHDPDDPQSLSNNRIFAICEDHAGELWIGTDVNGLNRFDRETGQFVHYQNDPDDPQSLSHNLVYAICEGRAGELWIGTYGGGLNRFDRETGQFLRYQHDPDDPQSLSHNNIRRIFEDRTGELWIGTHGGGLNRLDRETGQFLRYQHDPDDPQSLSHNQIEAMYEDHSGKLWIGTAGGGLNRFDRNTKQFVRYQHDPADRHSLNDNRIRSMYRDRSGVLWIGTKTGGLNTFDRIAEQFLHYQRDPIDLQSLSHDVVYALHEDQTGALWIGTRGGGLNRFDRETKQFIHDYHNPADPSSLSHDDIRSIYEDRRGELWIGTADGGLNRFDRETGQFLHYQHDPDDPQSLSHNRVDAICEDRAGELWIGTYGGLNHFDRDTEQFIRYQHDPNDPQSLSHDNVTTIYKDQAGGLWIGTRGGGLNHFDRETEQFHYYQNDPDDSQSLSNNNILSIYEDQSGVLWIGTRGGGLNKFDRTNETFTHYREKEGLPNDVVYGILEDKQGNLWLSTNVGLSKFNPRTETFKNYDVSDGLQGNEFNTGAYCKGRDGMMFFGGFNGFNAFYPENITDNPYIPPVVITDFQLFNKPVSTGEDSPLQKSISETEALTLSYEDFIFSFEFAALSYIAPEKNRYAYMMEGFEEDWNYVDSRRRFVTYTNLEPGRYVFRVKASNNDGVWNDTGTSIAIFITPPFWKTWWFRILAVLCLVGAAFVMHKMRMKYIESQKKRLEIQVAERTQELQQEITEREQAEEALRQSEERLRAQYKGIPVPTYTWQKIGENFVLVSYNDAAWKITHEKVIDFVGKKARELYQQDRPEIIRDMLQCFTEKTIIRREMHYQFEAVNESKLFAVSYSFVPPDLVLVHTEDITERKRVEDQLRASLREKEVLLKEIHHRVKNNLQVVSSLLKFQSERIHDTQTHEMFRDCQNRIKSMALIHENLYQSKDLARIDFTGYIRNLTASLFRLYEAHSTGITPIMDIEEIELDIDIAIACGLIVNELVSNSLKYAFPRDRSHGEQKDFKKEIRIILSSVEDQVKLLVSDTGVGFPNDRDFRSTDSLGLQLVCMLTEQLNGTIVLKRQSGTTFTITFPKLALEEGS
jgi:ligand-binding sensor domain-containing protein/two-component sensor histidine kinase